jgi:hypothetical protein
MPDGAGIGEPRLPGAAFVEPGMPGPAVLPGIGEVIGFPGEFVFGSEDDIGRGAIVIGELGEPVTPPVPVEPPLPAVWPIAPAFVPPATAVARQTYFPLPLPYGAEPFM